MAEDEEVIRKSLAKKARAFFPNARIVEARDGREAYERIQSDRPDLALIDIRVPHMSGVELIEKCHGVYDCMFLIVSGYSEFEYAQKAIRYGAIGYLVKPVQKEELQDAFSRALALSGERSERVTSERRGVTLESEHRRLVFEKFINYGDVPGASPVTTSERYAIKELKPYRPAMITIYGFENADDVEESATLRAVKQHIVSGASRPEELTDPLIVANDYKSQNSLFIIAVGETSQQLAALTREIRMWTNRCRSLFDVELQYRIGDIVYLPEDLTSAVRVIAGNCSDPVALSESDGGASKALRSIANYVTEHCESEVSLKSVSERFSISTSHLSRLFKKSFGITYSAYVVQRRMERAKRLLAGSDLPIGVIAKQAGYDDIHYFYRVFKDNVGTTPVAFRKSLQVGDR